jgi:hypothetical protein
LSVIGFGKFVKNLLGVCSLKKLKVNDCHLKEISISELLTAVSYNYSIKTIDLSENDFCLANPHAPD